MKILPLVRQPKVSAKTMAIIRTWQYKCHSKPFHQLCINRTFCSISTIVDFQNFLTLFCLFFAEKICPAVLKSRSHAAEAGNGVFSLRDKLATVGTAFRVSMEVAEFAR